MSEIMSALHPWSTLADVIYVVTPLFASSVMIAVIIFILSKLIPTQQAQPTQGSINSSNPHKAYELAYLLVSSQTGIVFGMFVKIIGGFDTLGKPGESDTILKSIISVVILSIGILGSFITDGTVTVKENYTKPLGSLVFLLCFTLSGFYWKILSQ
jgi:hypothetical protein